MRKSVSLYIAFFTSLLSMEPPPRKRLKRQEKRKAQGKKIDFVIESFSKELVLKVFSFLSLQDLIQCAAVSLHWSRMANDEMVMPLPTDKRVYITNLFYSYGNLYLLDGLEIHCTKRTFDHNFIISDVPQRQDTMEAGSASIEYTTTGY